MTMRSDSPLLQLEAVLEGDGRGLEQFLVHGSSFIVFVELFRRVRRHRDRRAGYGMLKLQLPGVKEESAAGARRRAVFLVAHDRVSDRGEVRANLVRSPGAHRDLEQRPVAAERFHDRVARAGFLSLRRRGSNATARPCA